MTTKTTIWRPNVRVSLDEYGEVEDTERGAEEVTKQGTKRKRAHYTKMKRGPYTREAMRARGEVEVELQGVRRLSAREVAL